LEVTHEVAVGMGGIRTAGDLVLRMQLAKSMKINEAKKYVADKLGISPVDLSDCYVMKEIREDLDIGRTIPVAGIARGIVAKAKIAKVLGIKINSVERFKEKTGI